MCSYHREDHSKYLRVLRRNTSYDSLNKMNSDKLNEMNSERSNEIIRETLNELKCPVCTLDMTGQIMLCSTGHSLCAICKNYLPNQECPVCRSGFSGGRNYTLENIAAVFKFPCRNPGCDNENNCDYKIQVCILGTIGLVSCDWSGNYLELKKHMQDKHQEFINETNEKFRNLESDAYVVVNVDSDVFIIIKLGPSIVTYNDHLYCCMSSRHVSDPRCAFQLDIAGERVKFSMSVPCKPRCEGAPTYLAVSSGPHIAIPNHIMDSWFQDCKATVSIKTE